RLRNTIRGLAAHPVAALVVLLRRHPSSTLFPYTTLFRSCSRGSSPRSGGRRSARGACSLGRSPGGRIVRRRGRRSRRWPRGRSRSEEHTSELQSRGHLVCRLLLEKKKIDSRSTTRCGTRR